MKMQVRPGFCIGSHVLIMASGPDQSDELRVHDGDDESVSPQN